MLQVLNYGNYMSEGVAIYKFIYLTTQYLQNVHHSLSHSVSNAFGSIRETAF